MPIPTEPIGSIPRPPALLDAIARIGDGAAPALDPLHHDAIRDTVARVRGSELASALLGAGR